MDSLGSYGLGSLTVDRIDLSVVPTFSLLSDYGVKRH